MKSLIQSLEVSYFTHATEDRDRVDTAVASLLGVEGRPSANVAEGHFGNPIVMAEFHLVGEEAQSATERIISRMPGEMKESIRANLGSQMDEHSALYLRLDKQRLIRGEIASAESDPIRVRVKPRLYAMKGSTMQLFSRMLE